MSKPENKFTVLGLSFMMAVGLIGHNASAGEGAKAVKLKNIAAKVVVTPEARSDVALSVYYGNSKLPKILLRHDNGALVADGQLKKKHLNCHGNEAVSVPDYGRVAKEDLPTIIIKVPMDFEISSSGASFGQIGAADSLSLASGGCGTWDIASVTNTAKIALGGSGDIRSGAAKAYELAIGGSGDIDVGAAQSLKLSIGGSGRAKIAKLNGPAKIAIAGSGEAIIADGLVSDLDVSIAGSGDVLINAEVKDIQLSIAGAGDVRIAKHTGTLKKSVLGSGGVTVGPVKID